MVEVGELKEILALLRPKGGRQNWSDRFVPEVGLSRGEVQRITDGMVAEYVRSKKQKCENAEPVHGDPNRTELSLNHLNERVDYLQRSMHRSEEANASALRDINTTQSTLLSSLKSQPGFEKTTYATIDALTSTSNSVRDLLREHQDTRLKEAENYVAMLKRHAEQEGTMGVVGSQPIELDAEV